MAHTCQKQKLMLVTSMWIFWLNILKKRKYIYIFFFIKPTQAYILLPLATSPIIITKIFWGTNSFIPLKAILII